MGLLARGIEACGITTVCLALVRELALQVRAPRMLYLHWPFGHALLSLAQSAPSPGLVVDLPYRWRREVYPPVSDWTSMSEACAEGLREAIECVEKP